MTASVRVMPSAWVERRETADGNARYLVKYRLGGRESTHRYAGSFSTRREAIGRRGWVRRAGRDARPGDSSARSHATRRADARRCGRALARLSRRRHGCNGSRPPRSACTRHATTRLVPRQRIDAAEVAALVADLHAEGLKQETIRKSVSALAKVLDFTGATNNPARDRVTCGYRARNAARRPRRPPNTSKPSCR